MTKKLFCKKDLGCILTELNYFNNFKDKYLNKQFDKVNYGKRIGALTFKNLFDAADKYTYSNQVDESISETTINNSESLDEVISNYEANTQN